MSVAFVLGNGPTLPLQHLPRLVSQFTIGVNRILLSGFTPTAIAWCDAEIYNEGCGEMDASGAVLITTVRNVIPTRNATHHVLTLRKTSQDQGNASEFYASGNSGTAAARLCMALGFDRVHLLGMSGLAPKEGEPSDFWGDNKRHRPNTYRMFESEHKALLAKYPDAMLHSDNPANWEHGPGRTQEEWRTWLIDKLTAAGAEAMGK